MINFLTLDLTNYSCDADVLPIFDAALFVIRIIQIAVPFVLVIWGSLDFFKALIAGDEKEMRMKRKPFISRVVAALIILVLPWLVKLIAKQIAGSDNASNFWKCYDQATPKIDFSRWNGGGSSGGSSGGSAAAVAANQALFGLGTETGGSVRLPASYCGIYGLKTTYGVLSRWGVVAYGSSLDQVGILGHTPADIAEPLSLMCGVDFYDDTSADLPNADTLKNLTALSDDEFKALKIAIPKQFLKTEGADPDVVKCFEDTRAWFTSKGASVEEVDLPILDASIAAYYVIALSEAASNLSRFDGIRYGRRVDNGKGYDELYVDTRSEGFGPEVKRRIVIGNYVLSEQFSGDTYKKGMTVRARIQREVAAVFEKYDIILCPTCPTAAFKLGSKVDNPLEMYLSDLYTTFVNLARIPSINVPAGRTSADGMPIGMQFAGAMFSEAKIMRLAQNWENDHKDCGIPVK